MSAYTTTGRRRGAALTLLAALAALVLAALVLAALVLAAAVLTPARAAPPPAAVSISKLNIVSDPLLSTSVSSLVMTLPALTLASGTSALAATHTRYAAGDTITVDVDFSGPALLFTYGSNPTQKLMLTIGEHQRAAGYVGKVNNDDRVHRFSYLVGSSDRDNDGISIAADALRLHNSWFVRSGDASCDARTAWGALGASQRVPDCQNYAISLDLAGHTVTNDHRHRVRAQTPEATHNLTGRRVTNAGPPHILLQWEYSALLSDLPPTRFHIHWRVMTSSGAQSAQGRFKVAGSARQTKDLVGAERIGNGTLHYTIAAENSHGLGYSPTLVVTR